MAESILSDLAGEVLTQLGTFAVKQICLAWGVNSEKGNLEQTLTTIKALIKDAEKKQEGNNLLTDLLGKLKDALLDAGDILDEFQCEDLQSQMVKRGGIKKKVRKHCSSSNPFAFSLMMGNKIKDIVERFDKISAKMDKFNLKKQDDDHSHVGHREREVTHSSVVPSEVIGRNSDKENIIKLLMCPPEDGEKVSVIPIIGIGGLGKTTLAKLVYGDERVIRHFIELKMWVHVSRDFDLLKLTREILKSAINKNCDHLSFDQLQTNLQSTLLDKKFLLVLDDVWNDDRAKWSDLMNLLMGGDSGSKIIVTARSGSVASVMSKDPYNLGVLSPENCKSLFMKWAFREEENPHPNLLKIGEKIVEKCGGVPLALKTIGSLLFSTEESYWQYVKNSEIWKIEHKENQIIPALKLSYNELPSYLKRCFAFCSIFPKSYVYSSVELIQFWMAHGLLQSSSDGLLQSSSERQDLEDIGERYIDELRSRSLFQDVEDHHYFLRFKMHDLLHDLAFSVVEAEVSIINSQTDGISKTVRNVSFCDKNSPLEEDPSSLLKLHKVRTIFFPVREIGPSSESFVRACISKFNYLRVLNLSDSDFERLPSSIGNLKQLRYLSLSRNHSIKKLPNSICELQSLQTLGLVNCEELEKLPRDIGELISLRCLSITTKQMSFPEEGIGRLKSLRTLWISGCDNLKSLGEGMQHLTALRTLFIVECESLECLPRSMACLTKLETLVIADCEKLNLMAWEEGIQGLRSFSIGHLPELVALPQWLRRAADTLLRLRIGDCRKLKTLPDWLQNFKLLEKLVIEDCPELSALPEGMNGLTALKELKIEYCPKLKRRCEYRIGKDWLKIAHVTATTLIGKTSERVETGESSTG